jgi:hypothetical protein
VDEVRIPPAGDGFHAAGNRNGHDERELLAAACEAMRLLQDRQAHTPIEMLDPRERRVLKQLRTAIRASLAVATAKLGDDPLAGSIYALRVSEAGEDEGGGE